MSSRAAANGDYLIRNTGGFPTPTLMSACYWIQRLATNAGARGVFGLRDSGNAGGYIYYYSIPGDGAQFGWEHDNGTVTNIDVITLSLNVWYFIAISRAGTGTNQTTVYHRTATDTALTSVTTTFPASMTPNEEIVLSNGFNTTQFFAGRIAAMKQWSGAALTANELLAESYRYRPIRLANLHSWRPMIAPTISEAVKDFSGNGRDLTANGAPTIEDGPPIGWRLGGRRFYLPSAPVGGTVMMNGVSGGRSSAQSPLSATRGLSGNAIGQGRIAGAASFVRGLAGIVSGRSSSQGAFNAIRALSGTTGGKSSTSGFFGVVQSLAGRAQGIGRAVGRLFLTSELQPQQRGGFLTQAHMARLEAHRNTYLLKQGQPGSISLQKRDATTDEFVSFLTIDRSFYPFFDVDADGRSLPPQAEFELQVGELMMTDEQEKQTGAILHGQQRYSVVRGSGAEAGAWRPKGRHRFYRFWLAPLEEVS